MEGAENTLTGAPVAEQGEDRRIGNEPVQAVWRAPAEKDGGAGGRRGDATDGESMPKRSTKEGAHTCDGDMSGGFLVRAGLGVRVMDDAQGCFH